MSTLCETNSATIPSMPTERATPGCTRRLLEAVCAGVLTALALSVISGLVRRWPRAVAEAPDLGLPSWLPESNPTLSLILFAAILGFLGAVAPAFMVLFASILILGTWVDPKAKRERIVVPLVAIPLAGLFVWLASDATRNLFQFLGWLWS